MITKNKITEICCFGRCTGISFIDFTSIPVCYNKRMRLNGIRINKLE